MELKRQGVSGRYTPPGRLHLTLNFIGETKRDKEIAALLASLNRPLHPRIEAVEGGLFRRRGGGDLMVWHLRLDQSLKAYRQKEADALSAFGIPVDRRPYTPHLTLARDAAGAFLQSSAFTTVFDSPCAFSAAELVLFWSQYDKGSLVYTPLGRFPFGGEKGE